MNKKGFAATGILYTILVLFILLMAGILTMLYSRNNLLNKIKNEIKENFGSITIYKVYENGTPVYFNPVTSSLCNESEVVSTTGTKTGCMKWYIFNDNNTSSTVNMILDHNTTAGVAWNSSGSNSTINEAQAELDKLVSVSRWTVVPRLIDINEIARITGNLSFDSATATTEDWFYLDSNNQTQTAIGQGASSYAWLYDYTYDCLKDGCNYQDAATRGYWTSSPITGTTTLAWDVIRLGRIAQYTVDGSGTSLGIRPVITIPKSVISQT